MGKGLEVRMGIIVGVGRDRTRENRKRLKRSRGVTVESGGRSGDSASLFAVMVW